MTIRYVPRVKIGDDMTSTEVQFEEMVARIEPYCISAAATTREDKTKRLELIAATVVRETLPDDIAAVEMLEYLAGRGITAPGPDNGSSDWYEVCVGLIAAALCRYLAIEKDHIAA